MSKLAVFLMVIGSFGSINCQYGASSLGLPYGMGLGSGLGSGLGGIGGLGTGLGSGLYDDNLMTSGLSSSYGSPSLGGLGTPYSPSLPRPDTLPLSPLTAPGMGYGLGSPTAGMGGLSSYGSALPSVGLSPYSGSSIGTYGSLGGYGGGLNSPLSPYASRL